MGSSSYNKGIDWVTVGLYAMLVIFGWISIYAANFNPENPVFFDTGKEYFKQLVWIGLSLFFIGIIFLTDSKFFVEFAYVFYGFTLLLLVAVLLFGKEINGAKSWFEIGPIRFQPAELTKVATNLAIARVISRFGFSFNKRMDFIRAGFIVLTPMLLILLQNDTGSALVYAVFILVFYREGLSPYVLVFGLIAAVVAILTLMVSNSTIIGLLIMGVFGIMFAKGVRRVLLISTIIGGVTIGIATLGVYVVEKKVAFEYLMAGGLLMTSGYQLWQVLFKRVHRFISTYLFILWSAVILTFSADYFFSEVLSPYQLTRINVLFGIEEDPLGAGYNVNQSMIAIGSGGFSGKGFLQGTQTKFDFVPEQSTDFIFCTVGEE